MTPCSEKYISALKMEAIGSSATLTTYQITQSEKSEDHYRNNVGYARLSILTFSLFVVVCHLFQFFSPYLVQFEKYCQKVKYSSL
jgi:hypothetical protein